MLELSEDRSFKSRLPYSTQNSLLPLWSTQRYSKIMSKMFEFGKRIPGESIEGREMSPSINIVSTNVSDFPAKILLDFIISHAQGDQRPYLEVSVVGSPIKGLLDSGATRTITGLPGYQLFQRLGLKLVSTETRCTVANGQSCSSIGFMQVPFCLMGKTRVIDVLVIPELSHTLILGVDFWKSMEIVPDLNQDIWHFAENDSKCTQVCSIQDEAALTKEQRIALDDLVKEKISSMGTGLGLCKVGEHVIELEPGTRPIKQRYYPVSPFKQKIIDEELEKMLSDGVVEPSKSSWSSPICLVRKKDDTYRFCVDYRALNAKTKKDAYPIPYISAILDKLRNAKYLSSIDIKSAFWTVPLSESSREYTAFTIPGRGLYQFCRMPFGLCNSPPTWERIIDSVLGADLEPSVMVYLDDIILISQNFEDHLRLLGVVFDRLEAAGLIVSLDKCQFCRPELKYLGYVVDRQGLRPDSDKVEAIVRIPPPQNVGEIRRFIGTASWYRRFVPNFSSTIAPLTNLTKKSVKWSWTPDCDRAFKAIKEALISAPILTCPDFSRPFVLQTDASSFGLGACLTQTFEEGEKVICFLSRSLTRQEMKLTVTEKECLAVIWSVEKLRHYLEGVHFTVITDHHSLLWLHRLKDPQGRLARWALRLQPYDYTLVHRPGKDHIVADFLSRSVPVSVEAVEDNDISLSPTNDKWYNNMFVKLEQQPNKFSSWRVENNILYKYIKSTCPDLATPSSSWKMVVPKDKRREILHRCHDIPASGHVGTFKTYWKVCQRYYWPKMRSDISRYIKSCKVCAQQKVEQKPPAGLMGDRPNINQPWQCISLDYIGPFPRSRSGNTYALVINDYFTKYAVIFPSRAATAKSLTKQVEEGIFLTYGTPQFLICDNGTQMKSKEFQGLCKQYKSKIFYTASYHPQADPTERANRVVKTMIRSYIQSTNHRTWDENLAAIGCAIRTSRHETTGFTPYFLNFGREHKLYGQDYAEEIPNNDLDPGDFVKKRQAGFVKLFQEVQEKIKTSRVRNQRRYNLRRRPVEYVPGQEVWRKNKSISDAVKHYSAKLAPLYLGPFIIKRKTGTCTYELQDRAGESKGVWHVQNLKAYNPSTSVENSDSG